MKTIIKSIILVMLLMSAKNSEAQKEWNNWVMGRDLHLDWGEYAMPPAPSGPYPFLPTGLQSTPAFFSGEGVSSISNKQSGQLLFYSNGEKVWDKNYNIVPDAFGSTSYILKGNDNCTQSSLIIPFPDDPDKYYLFTLEAEAGYGTEPGNGGLYYSVINTNMPGPNPIMITSKDKPLHAGRLVEKLTATKTCDGEGYWVVCHGMFDEFFSYKVTSSGISSPIVSRVGEFQVDPRQFIEEIPSSSRGVMKFNKEGNKIALCNQLGISGIMILPSHRQKSFVESFDFDKSTGIVSINPSTHIYHAVTDPTSVIGGQFLYGLVFSENSNYLFLTCHGFAAAGGNGELWVFDVTSPSTTPVRMVSHRSKYYGDINYDPTFSFLVIAKIGGFYDKIENPNLGPSSTLVDDAYSGTITTLRGENALGLPNLVYNTLPDDPSSVSAGNDASICPGSCVTLGLPNNPDPNMYDMEYIWTPSLGNTSNPIVCPSVTTTYHLSVVYNHSCLAPFESDVTITVSNRNCSPCPPKYSIPKTSCAGVSNTFSIQSLCANSCLSPTEWDFGDSYTAIGNNVTHAYTTPGTYTVTVSTTDNCGQQSYIFTQTITITDCGCVQSLVATQMSCNEFNFALNCQACVKEMQINYFDGSPTVTCPLGCSFVHTFPTDGTYPVTMVVTLCDGTRLRLSTTVEVACSACQCEVRADYTFDGEHPMYFYSTSAVGSSTNILGYVWDFGDGNTVINDPNPTHDYGASGSYNVCLTVLAQHDIDKSKCWDQICLPVEAALKMLDGKVGSEFSTTQSNTKGDITIYPNPAYSSISIDYMLDIEGKANLEIVNAEGVVLVANAIDAQKGSVKLDVSGFADGLYICQIKQEGASAKTAKFSVVKH